MTLLLTQAMFDDHWPDGVDTMIDGFLATQEAVFTRFELDTPLRLAHFMGQITVESAEGTRFIEGLSYSTALRLMKVWPSRFPTLADAQPYVRNPEKLASLVYANRLGNRPGTDDPFQFRGRGYIQLTGRSMYFTIGSILDLDLVGKPDLVLDPINALACAAAFWSNAQINEAADLNQVISVTRRVNGGVTGLQDRIAATNVWKTVLGVES